MRQPVLSFLVLSVMVLASVHGHTQTSLPARGLDHTHARWSVVLAEHVRGDRFDYAALKKERVGGEI